MILDACGGNDGVQADRTGKFARWRRRPPEPCSPAPEAATRAATPMHRTGLTPTTVSMTALITQRAGLPRTDSTATEPVS